MPNKIAFAILSIGFFISVIFWLTEMILKIIVNFSANSNLKLPQHTEAVAGKDEYPRKEVDKLALDMQDIKRGVEELRITLTSYITENQSKNPTEVKRNRKMDSNKADSQKRQSNIKPQEVNSIKMNDETNDGLPLKAYQNMIKNSEDNMPNDLAIMQMGIGAGLPHVPHSTFAINNPQVAESAVHEKKKCPTCGEENDFNATECFSCRAILS